MSAAQKRAPRGAQQAELNRLTQALTRIQDLIREAGITPGREWETLGAVAYVVMRALAPVQS
jgi:hypothetical protein